MLECYAVKDKKMNLFQSQWFARGVVPALRDLSIAVNEPSSNLNRFPEDFALFQLCQLDETTGEIIPSKNGPVLITEIIDLKNKAQK